MTTANFEVFIPFETEHRNKPVELIRQLTDPKVGQALLAVMRVRRPGALLDAYQVATVNRSTVNANGMDINGDLNAVLKYLLIVQYTFDPQELIHDDEPPSSS